MDRNVSLTCGENALKSFIDRTTMYRLMLYYLIVLFIAALAASAAHYFSFSPLDLLWSAAIVIVSAVLSNKIFAKIFGAVTNHESAYITALILVLIMSPVACTDISGSIILIIVVVVSSASKYVLAIGKKHVFNPAAITAVFSTFLLGTSATWWAAGNVVLLPFIFIGGLIVVYKLQKSDLAFTFFISSFITVAFISANSIASIQATILYSVLIFFAFVMLTEPHTMPNTRVLRVAYGIFVGILLIQSPQIGPVYFSPELALVIGNLFAFTVSPKGRLILTFVKRNNLAVGIYEYIFKSDRVLHFKPGQYLEWTISVDKPDARGNRRFFTIASAPEQDTLALGVRFYDKPSAFKQALAALAPGAVISASSLGGDFTMPANKKKKLAFLAGGIGVTPFVSMARHCIASGESRDAVLLYSSKSEEEVAYRDVFESASRCGWRTKYRIVIIDAEYIKQEVPDYAERIFYISGPHGFVSAMKNLLINLGISRFNIKTDFFPGLA